MKILFIILFTIMFLMILAGLLYFLFTVPYILESIKKELSLSNNIKIKQNEILEQLKNK